MHEHRARLSARDLPIGFRHGLSLPSRLDPATSSKVDAIVYALTSRQAGKEMLAAATEAKISVSNPDQASQVF
jgi:hypothetical protein